MKGSSFGANQGMSNMGRHKGHTIASVCTMTACIGLFCLAFMLIVNITHIVRNAEEDVGITVFFDEGTSTERIDEIRAEIEGTGLVDASRTVYTSPEQAWENMQATYFEDSPELAEGFADDNPLADSASLEFHPYELEDQGRLKEQLEATDGVRRVNASELTASSLLTVSRVITVIAAVVIVVLIVVSAFLISNTIAMSIAGRKEEIHIMRYIGATRGFASRPFIVEGLVTGAIGAVIPLIIMFVVYTLAEGYVADHFSLLSSLFVLIPRARVLAVLIPASAVIGIGIGLIGSGLSVRRYLKV